MIILSSKITSVWGHWGFRSVLTEKFNDKFTPQTSLYTSHWAPPYTRAYEEKKKINSLRINTSTYFECKNKNKITFEIRRKKVINKCRE